MKLTPAQNGFFKGLLIAVATAATAYLADPSNLTAFSGGFALLVAGLASSLESHIRAHSGNGLFGIAKVD